MSESIRNLGETGPQHICLAVRDAEATSRFLSLMWGLGPWITKHYASKKEEMILGEPFTIKVLLAKLGMTLLELIEPVNSPNSIWAQFIDKNGEGIHHIAISLKNFENFSEKVKELEAQGCKKLIHARKPDEPEEAQWCYMEMRPRGMVVELMSDAGPGL